MVRKIAERGAGTPVVGSILTKKPALCLYCTCEFQDPFFFYFDLEYCFMEIVQGGHSTPPSCLLSAVCCFPPVHVLH